MGKKSKPKAGRSAETKSRSGKNNLWLILGGAVIMIAIVWVTMRSSSSDSADTSSSKSGTSLAEKFDGNKGHATLISTLDPAQFTGKARAAYQAAKEIPEVLVEL